MERLEEELEEEIIIDNILHIQLAMTFWIPEPFKLTINNYFWIGPES
jgi:hypothetical protein